MRNATLKVSGLPREKSRGFTLIELLVVIAIISLLSSIVLASLGTARAKAADAAIQSNLVSVRSSAELQYSTMGCYSNTDPCSTVAATAGACPAAGVGNIFGQTNIASQIAAAQTAGGSFATCAITAGGTAWAVAVVLKTDIKKAWCVDSTGVSKQIDKGIIYSQQSRLDLEVVNGFCH